MPASEFSDIFISYRRKDVEFVKQLVTDLQQEGKEVWVDWEDIPPGVEGFADEIKRGIEGADAFIAVLSPDYLDSTYCVDMELGYAVELNKKIIPIVHQSFEGREVPKGIGHINWIYFIPHAGQANAYDESFPKILDVLHTDLDHVRLHKRFLLRSVDWDNNGRSNSFLLSGDEIHAGEKWLTDAIGKDPLPTDLHKDYIARSRDVANQRQRMLLAGISVALVVSVILSILSLIGFNRASVAQATAVANFNVAGTAQYEAEQNEILAKSAEATAVKRAEITNIRQLSSRLDDIAKVDPFRAYQIGQELLKIDDLPLRVRGEITELYLQTGAVMSWDYEMSDLKVSDDQSQLLMATNNDIVVIDLVSGDVIHTLPHDLPVVVLDMTPDNGTIVSIDNDGFVYIWNNQDGTLTLREELDDYIIHIDIATIDDDQSIILVVSNFGGIDLLDLSTGEYTDRLLDNFDFPIRDVVISPFYNYMLTTDFDYISTLWDLTTGEEIYTFDGIYRNFNQKFKFTDDELFLISSVNDNDVITLYNLTNQEATSLEDILDVDVSMVTGEVAIVTAGGDLRFTTDGEVYTTYENLDAFQVHYLPDGTRVVVSDSGGTIFVVDVLTGRVLNTFGGNANFIKYIEFLSDDTFLTASSNQQIVWTTTNQEILNTFDISFETYESYRYLMLPDGLNALEWTWNDSIYFTDLHTGERTATLIDKSPGDNELFNLMLTPDGQYLVAIDSESMMYIWEINQRKLIHTTNVSPVQYDDLFAFSDDGSLMLALTPENQFTLWTIPDFEIEQQSNWVSPNIDDESLNPAIVEIALANNKTAYLGSFDSNIYGVDLVTGETTHTLSNHKSYITSLALSPDETRLASGSADSVLILWDLETQQPIRQFEGHVSIIYDTVFLSDGQSILTASNDKRMIQWDIDTGEAIRIFEGHTSGITQLDVSADSKTALTSSENTVKYWLLWFPNDDLAQWARDNLQVEPMSCEVHATYELPTECEE